MANIFKEQENFQNLDVFKLVYKDRYKIEVKNAELKNQHGLSQAIYDGIIGINIQMPTVSFTVNMKRILTLTK